MPTNRTSLGAAVVTNRIYAIGGAYYNASWYFLNVVEEYDITNDTWTTKANMPTARRGLEVIEWNQKIYAITGETQFGVYTTNVEEYNPFNDTWITKNDSLLSRRNPAVSKMNDRIYVMGGWNSDLDGNELEEYDPRNDIWRNLSNMSMKGF